MFLFFLVLTGCVSCQRDPDAKIPMDPAIKTGKLENGMTYYIRKNSEPKERAGFYIIQNVGALLENDDQNGLAHFLEHMAFNGTKHFPGTSLREMLARNGIAFGRDLNASTGQNETVYSINNVPTTNLPLMDSCLLILHDWANYLLLEEKEIDNERGVISEEWRTRRDSELRILNQTNPVLYKGSQYAKRDMIGDLAVIQNFDYQTIRDFYHDWYRTDLQAIAVVGDFDVDEMEKKIIELFSPIPAIEHAKPRPFFEIPEHDEVYYVLATDPEAQESSVSIYMKREDRKPGDRYGNLRDELVNSLYTNMIRARISEILQKGIPPFMDGSIVYGKIVRGYGAYYIHVTARNNEEELALKSILTENERVVRYGFTESELERMKKNVLTSVESSYKQRDKRTNEYFIGQIKNNFLEDRPIIDIEYYYHFVKSELPGITAGEIWAKAKEWNTYKNMVIVVTGPSEDAKHLTEQEVLKSIDEVKRSDIQPYEDSSVESDLIREELPGGTITETKQIPALGAEEWTLSNGAKVVFKQVDYNKDQLLLFAFSKGGISLYNADLLPSAIMLSNFVDAYGVGNFTAMDLQRALVGMKLSIGVSLSGLYENISGFSSPKDFTSLLELLYLQFQHPRFDREAHNACLSRLRESIRNAKNNPNKILQDSMQIILSNYHPRVTPIDEKFLNSISMEKIEQVYRERFQDASDFTFIVVGDMDAETAKPLITKYIGSIPSAYRKENWRDNGVRGPKKINKEIGIVFETPKATSVTVCTQTVIPYTPQNNIYQSILAGVLRIRYTENIREKEGGTYGVNVSPGANKEPFAQYTLSVIFDCDPEKASHLQSLVHKEMEDMMKNGPTQEELNKVTSNMLKERETARQNNEYWLNALATWYQMGYNPDDPENYEDVIKNTTPTLLREFSKKMFTNAEEVDLIFKPKQ